MHAFDAGRLTADVHGVIAELAVIRAPDDAALRRAVEAALEDASLALVLRLFSRDGIDEIADAVHGTNDPAATRFLARLAHYADTIETAECWQIALESQKTPSVIALTRQNLPTVRGVSDENLCKRGPYILAGEAAAPIRLIASGSEVQLAVAARDLLAKDGLQSAVVSMPSWELFAKQDGAYREQVLGRDGTVRVACEAATGFGWERWLGAKGAFVGMKGFGASAKASGLYKHFGITAEAIAEQARLLAR